MSNKSKIPLNDWQKEILSNLKSVWSSVHDCKKVHADFVLKMEDKSSKNNGKWYLNISPIVQEVIGGIEDGAKKTSCFSLDITSLILLPDWEIISIISKTSCSFCKGTDNSPSVQITAKFKDQPIEITIYLNPVHDTIQDTICTHQKK